MSGRKEDKIKQYLLFVAQQIEFFEREAERLQEEEKNDEANFAKIQQNICGIFQTCFLTSIKKLGIEEETKIDQDSLQKIKIEYLGMFDQIPKSWHIRLDQARKSNDVECVVIEEMKINMACILKDEFKHIWDEAVD